MTAKKKHPATLELTAERIGLISDNQCMRCAQFFDKDICDDSTFFNLTTLGDGTDLYICGACLSEFCTWWKEGRM